jgi:ADP-heptose:LPS heptosyltransferase
VRVGYAEGKATNFLTRKVSLKTNQYGAAIYHDLLQGFDIHSPCPQLTVNLPASDLAWADAECKRLGIEASGYVLIFGNGYPTNQWQPIIQDFQTRQPHVPIVLLQDESNCEEIAALQQICSNLGVTKPPDIGKLAATIAAASLILTVEGIPVQLAIAVQTYSVVLIGTTNPQQLLPINDKFIGICSETGNIANIQPDKILTTVWQN